MATTKTTQKQRLTNYLSSGKSITEETAMKKFGTKNLRAAITHLRNAGFNVQRNEVRRNGRTVSSYSFA